jgi:hypothetical protein
VQRLRSQLKLPIVGIETQNDPQRTSAGMPDITLNYGYALFAATRTLQEALERYRREDNPQNLAPLLSPVDEFEALFDYAGFSARARRYG